jgi:adenosylcobinamide-GDP ribazoletransferase
VRGFLDAAAFLTRLVPGRAVTPERLGAALWAFPLVGLALGMVCLLPALLLDGHPLAAAWTLVAADFLLTRGLHYDGAADVADACAVHCGDREGAHDRFWTVIKDSACGPFGATAVVLAASGKLALASELLAGDMFGPLLLAFALGRLGAVLLAFACRRLARPGLGAVFVSRATPGAVAAALVPTLALGWWLAGPAALLAGLVLLAVGVWILARTARAVGGVNGDFLGAAVLAGEVAGMLAAVALMP